MCRETGGSLTITPPSETWLHRAMKATPAAANRTLTVISAVYGFADRAELVPARYNPTRHVAKLEERGERRALTTAELKRLGEAMHQAEHPSTASSGRYHRRLAAPGAPAAGTHRLPAR